MFSNFSDRVLKTFDGLLSRGVLTENDVNSAMREIRVALLEADVPLNIAKDFVEKVKKKAVGEKLLKSVKPGDLVVKIVHDTLVELLSFNLKDEDFDLLLNKSPSIILMVGLQGSGKTTTAAKLANLLKLKKKKVLLSSLDISRPAAIEQLNQLSQGISVDYMDNNSNKKVSELIEKTMEQAKVLSTDVIIFDTAGRTQIDLPMMSEIKQIKDITKPAETILVADSLTGQIAVNVAKEFDTAVSLSGIILTRVDGDARGGAALSMKHVTGKPIKYIGVGEKITDLELFHPDRLANRILGMGDVVTLVEKAQQDLSEEKIKETEDELKKGIFTMDSYLSQLRQMKKMGGMEGVMSMLPGVNKMKAKMDQANIDEKMLVENEAIILSMTKNERENPKIISGSRRKRISKGAGVDVSKINKLLKQFKMMSDMMKKMSQGKKIPSGMIPDEMLNQLK